MIATARKQIEMIRKIVEESDIYVIDTDNEEDQVTFWFANCSLNVAMWAQQKTLVKFEECSLSPDEASEVLGKLSAVTAFAAKIDAALQL